MKKLVWLWVPAFLWLLVIMPSKQTPIDLSSIELKSSYAELKKRMFDAEWGTDGIHSLNRRIPNNAILSSKPDGYRFVSTEVGNLLISVKEVKPYPNGYRLILTVGNPTTAILTGMKFNIAYNHLLAKGEDYQAWLDNEKKLEYTSQQTFVPSSWTVVEITIAPAKEDESGYIEIAPEISVVRFLR